MELFTQQVLAGISTGAIYACMALAVVMIYQAIDHLNFAQGEMAMFSTFIAWQLIEKGVPANRIYCDYAGFRTLDSVLRARKVFGQPDFIVVSQHFHNERAVYIARRYGMDDVVAYDAADAETGWMVKMYARELLSRVMAVLDVEILQTKPKFLGKRIEIGEKTPPVDAQPVKQ